jgi:hypothetical protein
VLAAYHPDYARNRMTEASDASRKLKRASLHEDSAVSATVSSSSHRVSL